MGRKESNQNSPRWIVSIVRLKKDFVLINARDKYQNVMCGPVYKTDNIKTKKAKGLQWRSYQGLIIFETNIIALK